MKRFAWMFLFATAALAQSDPTSRSWNQPVEPFRIAGNLYYVGASDITSYLITTPQGHIVIDGGFVETAPQIEANIAKLGFRLSDVKILLGSHAHLDHAGGLAELKRATGAMFYATRPEARAYARGGKNDAQFGDSLAFPPVQPDRLLDDGEKVTLGGVTLTAHVTAGHTPGCTTWTTTIRDGEKNYDVVFIGSPSVPSNYKLIGNPLYKNAVDDYRRQFKFLRTLHPDIFLAAHGGFFGLAERRKSGDFIDHGEYAKFVDDMERAFEKRVAEETAAKSH